MLAAILSVLAEFDLPERPDINPESRFGTDPKPYLILFGVGFLIAVFGHILKVNLSASECSEYQNADSLKRKEKESPGFIERCLADLGPNQPGVTTPGAAVFKVAPQAKGFTLLVKDLFLPDTRKAAKIALPEASW